MHILVALSELRQFTGAECDEGLPQAGSIARMITEVASIHCQHLNVDVIALSKLVTYIMSRYIQVHTGMYWYVLVHTGMYWYVHL